MKQSEARARIVRAIFRSMLLAALFLPIAYAQESKDASYFCTREMAAGLAYNNSLKRWEGVQLPSEGSFSKFVLRMRFLKERVQKNILDELEDVSDYEVTITEAGSNSGFPCRSGGVGFATKIVTVVDDEGELDCSARTYSFKFNLENRRFISVFLHGYVDGAESNENTPMMSGGICTEIDHRK
jgi:hypothetical protein